MFATTFKLELSAFLTPSLLALKIFMLVDLSLELHTPQFL